MDDLREYYKNACPRCLHLANTPNPKALAEHYVKEPTHQYFVPASHPFFQLVRGDRPVAAVGRMPGDRLPKVLVKSFPLFQSRKKLLHGKKFPERDEYDEFNVDVGSFCAFFATPDVVEYQFWIGKVTEIDGANHLFKVS